MCTGICMRKKDSYFGRTLDVSHTYDEKITITPRNFQFDFRHLPSVNSHYAIIGTAFVADGYPLYYDGINECGLAVAALKYGEKTLYSNEKAGFENISSFEFIPKILTSCKDLTDARVLLKNINITNESFSDRLRATPLHWLISDKKSSIVVEPSAKGIRIYDNPFEILTNEPEFELHAENCRKYFDESACESSSLSLPGDSSAESRFIRATYCVKNSLCQNSEEDCIGLFFHILDGVKKIKGCSATPDHKLDITAYTSCYNINKGIYYYHTYRNNRICTVNMRSENLDSKTLKVYPMINTQLIYHQN